MTAYTGAVPDTLDRGDDWKNRGACRTSYEPDLWFRDTDLSTRLARTVCVRECPVRVTCLVSAMTAETGATIYSRWGVYGGLSRYERLAADPSDKLDLDRADADAPCGTYPRLLHHLLQGQSIDVDCWLGQIRRTLGGTSAVENLPGLALPGRPDRAPQAGPAPEATASRSRATAAQPDDAVPEVLAGLVWQPGQPVAATVPAPVARPARRDPFAGPAPNRAGPRCGTQEAYDRHQRAGEPIDPICWNAIGRHTRAKTRRTP